MDRSRLNLNIAIAYALSNWKEMLEASWVKEIEWDVVDNGSTLVGSVLAMATYTVLTRL